MIVCVSAQQQASPWEAGQKGSAGQMHCVAVLGYVSGMS